MDIEYLGMLEKTDEVIEQIIVASQSILNAQLRKFAFYNDPDAISYAYEALHSAIVSYSSEGGTKLSTYITVCIYNKLGSYARIKKNMQLCVSLSTIISEYGDELQSIIVGAPSIEVFKEAELAHAELMQDIDTLIKSNKSKRQQRILCIWRDSSFEATNHEIAKHVSCSQSYVSQVITVFRHKLKLIRGYKNGTGF